MRSSHRLLTALAAIVTATVVVTAQGLDIKLGHWRWTLAMGGAVTMPDSIPPDLQAKLRANAAKPRTVEDCVTAEDLKRVRLGVDDDEDCTVSGLKVTPRTADFQRVCTGDTPRRDAVHMESTSPTDLQVTVTRVAGPGPATTTISGTWIGAACKPDGR